MAIDLSETAIIARQIALALGMDPDLDERLSDPAIWAKAMPYAQRAADEIREYREKGQ